MPEPEIKIINRGVCEALCPTNHPTENPKFIERCYCARPVGHTGPHNWPKCSGLAATMAREATTQKPPYTWEESGLKIQIEGVYRDDSIIRIEARVWDTAERPGCPYRADDDLRIVWRLDDWEKTP